MWVVLCLSLFLLFVVVVLTCLFSSLIAQYPRAIKLVELIGEFVLCCSTIMLFAMGTVMFGQFQNSDMDEIKQELLFVAEKVDRIERHDNTLSQSGLSENSTHRFSEIESMVKYSDMQVETIRIVVGALGVLGAFLLLLSKIASTGIPRVDLTRRR